MLPQADLRQSHTGVEPAPDPRKGRTSKIEITSEALLCHVGRNLTSAHMLAMTEGLIPPCHRTSYCDAVLKVVSANVVNGLRLGQRVLPEQCRGDHPPWRRSPRQNAETLRANAAGFCVAPSGDDVERKGRAWRQ